MRRPFPRPTAARLPGRRGGALIEAILILPLLIMLSFGVVEYGWAFYVKHTISAAAYGGARNAITTGSTNATVTAAVTASLQSAGLLPTNYTVTTSPTVIAGTPAGTYVSVTITCTWSAVGVSPLSPSMGGLPANKQLTCTVLMAHE